MKSTVIIESALLLVLSVEACLKSVPEKGPWDKKNYPRKFASGCTCGHPGHSDDEHSSSVFIFIQNPFDPNGKTVCEGTIVTSNLIATSHMCLVLKTTQPSHMFERWKPKYTFKADVIQVTDIKVLPVRDENIGAPEIQIDKIIYHPRYIESVKAKKFPEQDIALLRIKDGDPIIDKLIFSDACEVDHICSKRPICVPTFEQAEDFFYIKATYTGTESGSGAPIHANRRVLPGNDCDKFLNKGLISGTDTVCIKYDGEAPAEMEGGPLIKIEKQTGNHDLVGLASWVGSRNMFKPKDLKVAYFTHVKSFVKYLEYQASIHDSKWCELHKPLKIEEPHLPTVDEYADEALHLLKTPKAHKEDLNCACGHSNVGKGSPRIMGGIEAIPHEFGWLVKLIVTNDGHEELCGGSIINDRMILTAGHCFLNYETGEVTGPENVKAYIKAHKNRPYVDPEENRLTISKVIVNQKYIDGEMQEYPVIDYDIALLILSKPLKFPSLEKQESDSVVPICLPQVNNPIDFVGMNATVAGWGINETNPEKTEMGHYGFNPALHKLSKPILPLSDCKNLVKWLPLGENQICGSTGLISDSAQGDSGGPLIVPLKIEGRSDDSDPNFHWVQVGLVSFGQDTVDGNGNVDNGIGVYTNVQTFLSFIELHASVHEAKWCKFETN